MNTVRSVSTRVAVFAPYLINNLNLVERRYKITVRLHYEMNTFMHVFYNTCPHVLYRHMFQDTHILKRHISSRHIGQGTRAGHLKTHYILPGCKHERKIIAVQNIVVGRWVFDIAGNPPRIVVYIHGVYK